MFGPMMRALKISALSMIMVCFATVATYAQTAYIPHLTGEDGGWTDYLVVDNLMLTSGSFTLKLYKDGSKIYDKSHSVSGLGQTALKIKDLASGAQCGTVEYSDDRMVFRVSYEFTSGGGGVAEFKLPTEKSAVLGFFFSGYSPMVAWKGMALANFGSSSATATLYAIGGGKTLGSTTVSVPGNSRVRGVYTSWFPSISSSDIEGIVAVTTSSNLSGIAISGDSTNSKLLFTTATAVSSFTPGDIPTPGTGSDLTGTWNGEWDSTIWNESDLFTMYLTQNGDSLSGTMDIMGTDCGTVTGVPITGTVSGSTFTIEASHTCQGETATTKYTQATVINGQMVGIYTLYVDGNTYDKGTFTATK